MFWEKSLTHNNVAPKLNAWGQKIGGEAFKAPPPGSYRVKWFDCVDRTLLWQRMICESNVNGKLFRVIYNMYDAAKSCIKIGNNFSEVFHCNIGVRQGQNLSPILFAMLINEFKNNLSTHYNEVHLNQLN